MIDFKVTNTLSEDEKMIRETVFIEEQKFKIEFDDTDDIATHIVMYLDNHPVGCCRLYKQENEYHIGRIAVLKSPFTPIAFFIFSPISIISNCFFSF